MKGTVEYDSNNSGGYWWLKDKDWKKLEEAGWEVEWFAIESNMGFFSPDKNGRWLGALASSAKKKDTTLQEAIYEWEAVTGQFANDLGCSCCGAPHHFTLTDADGNYLDSYSPEYPAYGERPW